MTHGSLFSGIGGFDLAAEWAGWTNVFHCEINPFGQKVLKYYWPNAISYDDITKTDFTIHRGRIDVLTGGFPCQPFSVAGKRMGTADHRNLWPEYFRAIKEIQPLWVVGENVPGLLNWSGGLVFEQVQADLESEGYEVWPVILPACSVNAPHKRDRVWFVAYANSIGRQDEQKENGKSVYNGERNNKATEQGREQQQCRTGKSSSVFSNTNDTGCEEQRKPITDGTELFAPKCNSWWKTEPGVGRVVDGLPGRVDRLKGLGNAIVPQVAYQIFRAINQFNNQ